MKLTNEIIDGRTDDQLIEALATKVMGWIKEEGSWFDMSRAPGQYWICDCRDWNPLTDWNHTMKVVNKMIANAFTLEMGLDPDGGAEVEFADRPSGLKKGRSHDKNEKRAICLAALKATISPPQPVRIYVGGILQAQTD